MTPAAPSSPVTPAASEDAAAANPSWPLALLMLLVVERLAYVLSYLGEVPFAVAPVSDGELYVRAALDILARPPLGTEPFWLQGAYAYFVAFAMWLHEGTVLVLPLQLLVCAAAYVAFTRWLAGALDRTTALVAMALLLAGPQVAFYETKHLTGALTVAAVATAIAAHLRLARTPRVTWALVAGALTGIAWLLRPNLVLAAPPMFAAALLAAWPRTPSAAEATSAEATAETSDHASRNTFGHVAAVGLLWILGFVGSVTPLAVRNLEVVGSLTVMPVHGGGTSFWIGNNPQADGLWNHAGGSLSGDVAHEGEELGGAIDLEEVALDSYDARRTSASVARAHRISRELYARSFEAIRADPPRWLGLELRKLSLTFADEALASDYDFRGERDLLPWAHRFTIPLSVLVALALLGIEGAARRPRREVWTLALVLGGPFAATLFANLAFFTSAQHRLPLVVPLAVLAALGVRRAAALWRDRRRPAPDGPGKVHVLLAVLAALIVAHGARPRVRDPRPSSAHYYNLSLAYRNVDDVERALVAIEHAVERDPDQPLYRLEHAIALGWVHEFDRALAELDLILARDDLPAWVLKDAERARESLRMGRDELADRRERDAPSTQP